MEDETYKKKIRFKITNIISQITEVKYLIIKTRGVCEVFISVSCNPLSSFFYQEMVCSACLVLSCHIGLEPTV